MIFMKIEKKKKKKILRLKIEKYVCYVFNIIGETLLSSRGSPEALEGLGLRFWDLKSSEGLIASNILSIAWCAMHEHFEGLAPAPGCSTRPG